ncbi:hypothetical protein [Bdellovibrio bacteriovorus]|uniref:hypothetical protein n=1 Tax=Bdellovibrio bacteriovorus TaxID=959 RepID=UPI003D05423C
MIKNLKSEVEVYIRKNPSLILFSFLGSLFLTVMMHQNSDASRKFLEPALYGFLLGLPICLGADYIFERRKVGKFIVPCLLILVFAVGYLLSYYLGYLPCLQLHVAMAAYLLLLLTPSAVRKDEAVGLHWLIYVFYALGLSIFISGALLGLLSFLAWVIKELFAWELPKVVAKFGVSLLCVFLPVNLFAHFKPDAGSVASLRYSLEGVVERVVRFLFTPVMVTYQSVLLIYSLKVLVAFELPQGMVSKPISVAYFLYFSINAYLESQGRSDVGVWRYRRWFHLAFVPLFLLMAVGIAKRIGDYGFTAARVYLIIVFIVIVSSWLMRLIYKRTELRKVLVFGSVLLLATSMGPLSPSSVAVRSQSIRFLSVLEKYGKKYQTLTDFKISEWSREDLSKASSALEIIDSFKAITELESLCLEKGVFLRRPEDNELAFKLSPDLRDQLASRLGIRGTAWGKRLDPAHECMIYGIRNDYRDRKFRVTGYDYLLEMTGGHVTIPGTNDLIQADKTAGRMFVFSGGREELLYDYGKVVKEKSATLGADFGQEPLEFEGKSGGYQIKVQIRNAAVGCENPVIAALLYVKIL